MIDLNWKQMDGQIGALMKRFDELPRHIAKKHLVAAVKRAAKDGIPILKATTPVRKTRTVRSAVVRGQVKQNVRRRGGSLRRAAIVKATYKGRNKDGSVVGTLGYKYGPESRKAIWLEFGTSRGVAPRGIMEKTMRAYGGPAAAKLASEMSLALEKAAKELEAGINPGGAAGFRRK